MGHDDYSLQNIEMMADLTSCLKTVNVKMREYSYHPELFGSWWFTFTRYGERYRLIFDGKESCLRLEKNKNALFKSDWQELRENSLPDKRSDTIIDAVLSIIKAL